MKLEIMFCELHTPLFMAGVNFGTKLDPTKRTDLKLTYDREEKELLVQFKDKVSIVPSANVANMVLENPLDIGIQHPVQQKKATKHAPAQVSHPMKAGIASAQVSTPQDHVFKT